MDGWRGREYALARALGAIGMLVWATSRTSGRDLPYGGSFLIGLGLLAGLKHPVRRQIYDHLRLLPGDHFRSVDSAQPAMIAKVLGISRQLASYHLRCLEKAGRVRRHGAQYRVVSGRR